jgi:glycosyltransferase involved in cell wall biosynthesis
MIPKTIHYCWFTKGDPKPLPAVVETCIASWKKHCPDWEIKLWNEENFDVSINNFTREAYEAGKMGFVADYIRAYLVYTYGGIYMDTDLELLQNIDFLLENKAFIGNENIFNKKDGSFDFAYLGTAFLGDEEGHPYFKSIMDFYEKQHFINPNGSINQWCTSNYVYSKVIVEMYGKLDRETKTYGADNNAMTVYSKDVMYPYNRDYVKPESISLHHCLASWLTPISIVMPCYNAEKTIAEAIESILNQSFNHFELIIVDDGSTDATIDVIQSYRDNRIVLVENRHDFIDSLNLGMRRASGRYIARMDADDIMLPERLQIQYNCMEAHPEIDLLAAGMQFFGDSDFLYVPLEGQVTLSSMISANRIAHPTVMLRRESLKKLPELYRKEYLYAEDYDLWMRMIDAGMTLYNLPDIVLYYRKSSRQLISFREKEVWEVAARIRERYKSALTVIIPFLNEGIELERTVQSIRNTTAFPLEIILINDHSDDGYDYEPVAEKYACHYVRHSERQGVAASRDEGVEMCQTPYFMLLDAHIEFYKPGWDLDISCVLQENPEAILCCQTKVLRESRENVIDKAPAAFGAYLSLSSKDILKCTWNQNDHSPNVPVMEIPVILGGAYAACKTYWQHLHGLKGLINYGLDEELISLKCWMEGGRCLLLKNLVAGHIYRSKFPYPVNNDCILHNKLLIVALFFDETAMRENLFRRLKAYHGEIFFDLVYDKLDQELIASEREYLRSICRKDLAYFLYQNAALR